MDARFAEDFKAGDIFYLGKYQVSRKEIVEFALKYDPFPFHYDDEAAAETGCAPRLLEEQKVAHGLV